MKPSRRFNLRIEYCYGLGVSHKIACRLVLPGPVGSDDVATIKDRLEDGVWFIPGQVLLPELCCSFNEGDRDWNDAVDQPWHALEQVNLTTKPITPGLDLPARTVIEAFQAVQWDDGHRVQPKPVFIAESG